MDPDADWFEWDTMLQSQGVKGQGVCCRNERADLLELSGRLEMRLECLQTMEELAMLANSFSGRTYMS